MIDVHMLVSGNERKDWLDICLQSLKGSPITLHICDVIPGNTPKARSNAIRQGNNEWIGWVDPDDYIIPGSYQRLLDIVGDKKFAWSKEEILHYDEDSDRVAYKSYRTNPHHMHIIHRSILNYDVIEKSSVINPDAWPARHRSIGAYDDQVGYVWRKYSNSSSTKLLHALTVNRHK